VSAGSDDSGDSGGLGVSDGAEVSGAKGGKKGKEGCAGQIGPVKWCVGCGPEGSGRLDIQFFFRLFAHLLDVSIFIKTTDQDFSWILYFMISSEF
jgi:hypothetical protein